MKNILILLFVLALSACATPTEDVRHDTDRIGFYNEFDDSKPPVVKRSELDIRRDHFVSSHMQNLVEHPVPSRMQQQIHIATLTAYMTCVAMEVYSWNPEDGAFTEHHQVPVWGNKATAFQTYLFAYVQAAGIYYQNRSLIDVFYIKYNTTLGTFVDAIRSELGPDPAAVQTVADSCQFLWEHIIMVDERITDHMANGTPAPFQWEDPSLADSK